MRIKRVVVFALLVLMLTACGKEKTSVDSKNDKNNVESVAQTETKAETTSTKESVTSQESEEIDVLDAEDFVGTWLEVGGEVDGDIWESIPGYFEMLVFRLGTDQNGESENIYVDTEVRDYGGSISDCRYQEMIEILDEPIYEGCGNEEWSVRIGEESEQDENGFPINREFYATLLDQNTLLRQSYFTIDGTYGVSYQTFKRIFPEKDAEGAEATDVQGNTWELCSYVDQNGNELKIPDRFTDFLIDIKEDLSCEMSWTDLERDIDFRYKGQCNIGRGGSVLLQSNDYYNAWYAGGIRKAVTEEEPMEIRLYHEGGWLCFQQKEEPAIPILDVLYTTLSRQEHEGNRLICSAIRDSIRLNDQDAVRYPKLVKALETMTSEDIGLMEESVIHMKDLYDASESYNEYVDEEILFVQRADSRILSVREEFYAYSGGVHPMYGAVGYNYDTQTGKKLELTDVVTDVDKMMDLVEQKLYENFDKEMFYPDVEKYFDELQVQEINWIMGYQGITFYFIPYTLGPYALGMQEVTVYFVEDTELFVDYYTQVPESGYVVSLPVGRFLDFDRDASDNWSDLISAYAETSNGYAFDKLMITLNEETYVDSDICISEIALYLVCAGEPGNSNYYLYVYGGIEDGHKMYIYDLNQDEVKRLDLKENVFFPGEWYSDVEEGYEVYYEPVFTDPTDFTMHSRMWNLGVFLGEKDYYVDADTGLMLGKKKSYTVPESTWPITLKVPLELETLVDGEIIEYPAGNVFYYKRTDGVSYVDVCTEGDYEYRIEIDTSGEYVTINGMAVEECFDGVASIW